jgi:Domain of unknown function (DUF4386)
VRFVVVVEGHIPKTVREGDGMAVATAEPTIVDGRHSRRVKTVGRVFGWFFLATILTSIPAYFIGYSKMLDDPGLITGTGADPSTGIATGATLEVLLIVANVATAVVAYPFLKRESEIGAIGYVSARLVEAIFIAIGIVSALAFLLMRLEATATSAPVIGEAFVSLYYRAFLVGPGFFAGLANGVILGYLMYRSELVPRGMTWLGLIGGPLVMITGILVMFNAIERGGAVQAIATLPEGLWELSLSIYCIVKGFRLSSPILKMETVTLPESDSALRHGA